MCLDTDPDPNHLRCSGHYKKENSVQKLQPVGRPPRVCALPSVSFLVPLNYEEFEARAGPLLVVNLFLAGSQPLPGDPSQTLTERHRGTLGSTPLLVLCPPATHKQDGNAME